MTSTEPPLAVIASSADLENLAAFTVNFLVNSPLPRILIPDFSALTIPVSIRTTGVTSAPSSKTFNWSRFTIAYSLALMLVIHVLEDDGTMEFVHLQNQGELRHRYELFDLFDHGQMFYRYLMKYHDQRGYVLYENLSAGFNS